MRPSAWQRLARSWSRIIVPERVGRVEALPDALQFSDGRLSGARLRAYHKTAIRIEPDNERINGAVDGFKMKNFDHTDDRTPAAP